MQFDTLCINDTGAARDSISCQVDGNTLKIDGLLRVVVLITGRKAGKFPPIDQIEDWVIRKLGVPIEQSRGVAFAIAKKIAEQGTRIYRGEAKGLKIQLILNELNEDIAKMISEEYALSVGNTIYEKYLDANRTIGRLS